MVRFNPSVSVIVLTYNAHDFVEPCITALSKQSFRDFEIIVVDNASSDGTAELVRRRFPEVRVIASPRNDGYGAGNNLGATEASGKTLVFLNPDAIPEPDWLANLIGAMCQHGRKFATSKIVLQSDHGRLNSAGNLIHYLGLSFCRGLRESCSHYGRPELVSSASGAACAISRDLFDRIGGFDTNFFLYHDDTDLSLRALLADEPCLYVPDAVVSHDYDLSLPPAKWGWVESHRYAMLLKTYRLRTLVLLAPALLLLDLLTLTYLATRGNQYVRAKFASYCWLFRNLGDVLEARRHIQRQRKISDQRLLELLVDAIPFEQVASRWLARVAHAAAHPFFAGYRRMMLSLVRW